MTRTEMSCAWKRYELDALRSFDRRNGLTIQLIIQEAH